LELKQETTHKTASTQSHPNPKPDNNSGYINAFLTTPFLVKAASILSHHPYLRALKQSEPIKEAKPLQ